MEYIVQDEETGNYASSDSVFKDGKKVLYSTHTGGDMGLEYSNSYEISNKIAIKLKNRLQSLGIHKTYKIIAVIKENLVQGELVITTYNI